MIHPYKFCFRSSYIQQYIYVSLVIYVTEWEAIRIPKELYDQISKIVKDSGFWVNEHEFIRDAVREKLGIGKEV